MSVYTYYKWFSRILGLLFLIIFSAYIINEGIPDVIEGKANDWLWFLPFAMFSFFGYVAGWKWPFTGGWTMMIGGLLLIVFFLFKNEFLLALIFSSPSLLIGFTFIAASGKSYLGRIMSQDNQSESA
ncbi:MAG: hypothetical protein WCH29_05425 [Chitinophagaceae bacterium]